MLVKLGVLHLLPLELLVELLLVSVGVLADEDDEGDDMRVGEHGGGQEEPGAGLAHAREGDQEEERGEDRVDQGDYQKGSHDYHRDAHGRGQAGAPLFWQGCIDDVGKGVATDDDSKQD